MQNVDGKFALGQSNATISVAYNNYCDLLSITSLMKQGPDVTVEKTPSVGDSLDYDYELLT